jgi:hypothetical protein
MYNYLADTGSASPVNIKFKNQAVGTDGIG